jgi:hypothetical protein
MFGKLKRLFKSEIKKPISKMSNYSELSPEELHEKFSAFDFTWIKGDNTGNTERFVKVSANDPNGPKFIVFQGGNRINVDLMDEYMAMFPKAPSDVIFESAQNQAPQLTQPLPIPNQQNKSRVETSVQSISYADQNNINSDSPIYKLLAKQKKNLVDVNIKLKINLPSRDLYNVLIDSFEGAEDDVIDFIINGIEIDDIKKSLADSIKKNYYNKVIVEKNTLPAKFKKPLTETE